MPKSRRRSLLRVVGLRQVLPAVAAALAILATLVFAHPAEAASARITADGDCLNVRATPSISGTLLICLGDGTVVTIVPGTVTADDVVWQQIRTATLTGWAAAKYLTSVPDQTPSTPTTTASPPIAPSTALPFEVPPPGGTTFGVSGTTSVAALVAAQKFEVVGVSAIEPATQRYLTYIPGAPAIVNTLEPLLRPDMVVMVRRTGTSTPLETQPLTVQGESVAQMVGAPIVFSTPSRDGLTLGVTGTNDVAALIKAQPFAVDVIMALDVSTQRWLTYIPGAPEWLNTLNRSTLRPSTAVFIRRSATAPDPAPPPVVKLARAATVPITYYYCTQTSTSGAGDGGGFCGSMRNGMIVHAGAASCDQTKFGQRFRVASDPSGMIYTCMDTGGGVSAEHRDIWFATSGEGWAWWTRVAPGGFAPIEVLDPME